MRFPIGGRTSGCFDGGDPGAEWDLTALPISDYQQRIGEPLAYARGSDGGRGSDPSRDRQGAVSLKQATDNYCFVGAGTFFAAGAAVFLAGAAGAAGGGP